MSMTGYDNFNNIGKITNNQLYDLELRFDELIKQFPKARKKLCAETGKKMYDKVITNIERGVKEDSGNLKRAVTMVIGSGGGYAAVKPNWKIAPHTHLVENGHRIVWGKSASKWQIKHMGKKDMRTGRGTYTNGKHMYRNALNDLIHELETEAEKMVNNMLGECFG